MEFIFIPSCFRVATAAPIALEQKAVEAALDSRTERVREPSRLVLAPKDYFLGPIFAATKQSGPRDITIGQRRYQIGGFHPMRPDFHPPALDIRHARAIFALLSFRDPFEDTRLIRFSFNEFCQRYARSNGGRYAQAIKQIVADLMDSYIRVTDLDKDREHEYRLIERIDIEKRPPRRKDAPTAATRQRELWFNGCTLSPEFYGLLGQITELQHLKLEVFTSIRSPLAQSIYLYLPSRAYHHSENDPFEITVTRILEQVAYSAPKQKCRRWKIFAQRSETGTSVIQQLDGVETLKGMFRVRLSETTDRQDWKLLAWIERITDEQKLVSGNSKLVSCWLRSGHTKSELQQRLANVKSLSDYELDLLERAAVQVSGNERFFKLAKAMLPATKFSELLAEAKGDEIEGRKAVKTQTTRLIWRIKSAILTHLSKSPALDNRDMSR